MTNVPHTRIPTNTLTWVCTHTHTHKHSVRCAHTHTHLELDEHALAAHTAGAPQVVDVFVLLVQLPSADRVFTGPIIT